EKYQNRDPNEMRELWSNYGFGTFMQGYFKSVNPDEFKLILEESSQRYKHAIVLFATGMGDLIIWSDGYVRLLNYRHGIIKPIMYTFEFLFQNMNDLNFTDEDFSWQTYPEALNQYYELKYAEWFRY